MIIPIYNEEAVLPFLLDQSRHWPVLEVIFVDGGSRDQSKNILEGQATTVTTNGPTYHFLLSEKGRGNQMNQGATFARGESLLFLHADSILPPDYFLDISNALKNTKNVGGAFQLKISSDSLLLKWIAMMANLRSSLFRLPYGDQGIFVRRELFQKMGGYLEVPIMEDVDFIRRLGREGKIVLLPHSITTSARRWNKNGIIFTSSLNIVLLLLYWVGVSPKRLVRWYH
ncbi:MAG: TIGR04283 family arsenosugar biosynthesis glycosyltransferase [Nitrospirota bacterium]